MFYLNSAMVCLMMFSITPVVPIFSVDMASISDRRAMFLVTLATAALHNGYGRHVRSFLIYIYTCSAVTTCIDRVTGLDCIIDV